MKYGHFSKDFTEYIVTRPDTIRPWQNHFGNREYGVLFSQCGSGFAVAGDDRHTLVNYYIRRYDQSGRYVYLRDNDTGDYWALNWQPVRAKADSFECRHGRGYSIITSKRKGIEAVLRVFVPVDDPIEIWTVAIRNTSKKKRSIIAFPFIEWVVDNARVHMDDLVYAACSKSEYDADTNSIIGAHRRGRERAYHTAFFAADFKPAGYDCRRADFVGPGRTLADPIAVEEGRTSDRSALYEVAVGAFSKKVVLQPGKEKTINLMVGMAKDASERKGYADKYFGGKKIEKAFAKVGEFWDGVYDSFSVETPDRQFSGMFNHWIVKHVYTMGVSNTIRCFAKGFRNVLQDSMAILPIDPKRSRSIITRAAEAIHLDGQPLGGWSVSDAPDRTSTQTDLKFWLVLAACFYVRETGDFGILKERSSFVNSPKDSTLLEKLTIIMERSTSEMGPHGLSLVGGGDWNDNLNGMGAKGRGESVWLTFCFILALREMAALMEAQKDRSRALRLDKLADRLCDTVNKCAWDGKWYIMGFDDNGTPVGSSRNKEGRIFTIVQAWAIICGAAPPDRIETMIQSLKELTLTEYGYALMDTPYTIYDPNIGSLSFVGPGMSENASVYSHVAAFLIYALGRAGMGTDAYDTYRMLMPYTHDPEVTQAADFALPNFYRGPSSQEKFGCIHRMWTTSTPSWVVKGVAEAMMGVRVDYDGFIVSPGIPADWKKCTARRRIRGAQYEIRIENPDGVESGVKGITLDGEKVTSAKIPFAGDGALHKITVTIG